MSQERKGHHKRFYRKLLRVFFAGIMVISLGGFFIMAAYTVNSYCQSVRMNQPEDDGAVQNEVISVNNGQPFIDDKVSDGNMADKTADSMADEIEEESDSRQSHADIILVNKEHPVPEDYFVSLVSVDNGQQVSSAMYEDLCNMLSDGKEQDRRLSFLIASGYRTKEKQESLVKDEINKNMWYGMDYDEACEDAFLTVAPAGFSEHETGLAVDIVAVANQRMDETQENTRENQWLQENCYKYGFILRYPKGKEDITGFSYESWHFRYVGVEAAAEITGRGMALEEYLEE